VTKLDRFLVLAMIVAVIAACSGDASRVKPQDASDRYCQDRNIDPARCK
jgi:hypothetical protein